MRSPDHGPSSGAEYERGREIRLEIVGKIILLPLRLLSQESVESARRSEEGDGRRPPAIPQTGLSATGDQPHPD